MIDYALTPDQIAFRDTVRDFVNHEVKPFVLDAARLQDLSRPLPLKLIDEASRMGLRTLSLSEASGGAAADHLTACIVTEELGAGDVDVAMPLAHTAMLASMIFDRAMTSEQRGRFLPGFLDDDRCHLAFAAALPNRDLRWKYHRAVDATLECGITAVQRGDDWVLNGENGFVANAPLAKLMVVQARASGSDSLLTLLVEREIPGLMVEDCASSADSVKWYHGAGGKLKLTDCKVAAANVISTEKANALETIDNNHPQFCAMNIGVGRAAFEAAIEYAKLRVQGGRPIIQHQAIGTILAEVAIKLKVARDAVWHAAWAIDHPEAQSDFSGLDLPLGAIAHAYTAEAIYEAVERAAECFGAMGVMLDMPLPKYLRDARMFLHTGVSGEVDRFRIAEAIAGFERAPLLIPDPSPTGEGKH